MKEYFIQQYEGLGWWDITLRLTDLFLFLLIGLAVMYLFIFAISSLFGKKDKYKSARKQHKFVVLYTITKNKEDIINSIESILHQNYPTSLYDVVVISNSEAIETNEALSQYPIKMIITEGIHYTKERALQYAMTTFDEGAYQIAVIMDAGNKTDDNFLEKINNAYFSGGMAMQTHRVSMNLDSDTAVFQAVSEEINNSIFRRGHVNLGFSAAFIGSGMAINFDWLKKNLKTFNPIDIEKQLEKRLIEQYVFIDYLNEVKVYANKINNYKDFYQQGQSWISNRRKGRNSLLWGLPKAIFRGNYDYIDKCIQWIMPSRLLLMGILTFITILTTITSWNYAIKWWGLLLMLIVSFSMALPDYLVDARFIKAMRNAPMLFLITGFNVFRKKLKTKK